MREIISDAKDEIGDTCAVTIRLALDEMAGLRASPMPNCAISSPCMPISRSVGLRPWQLGELLGHLALQAGSRAGRSDHRLEETDAEAGRRRRPLHLARSDGAPGEAGHSRFRRRGAAVDRRSLPAEERSRRAASTTSANASAAISACPATSPSHCRAARRIPPSWRNGARAGTRNACGRAAPTRRY